MMNLSHYMNLRLLKQLLQAQNSASNKSVTHEDCLPHTFFHSDQNSDSVEKMSSVKTISTHTELSSAVTPENILISPSGKSLPSWENIRYFHSSKESDDLHSRHSPLYICRKEVPLDPCLILRSLEATPNQIATSSNGNITVGTETLSPRKICINVRDSELDKTPTFPDCRSVQEPPMTTSRKLAIIVYSSQALSCKTNTDACYPKEMGASSGIILSDCKQISEMTSMNHIKTEDYHSITVNTACIKTDFQKQLSASLKNPEHENLQFHPSKDYASELREDMPAGRYFEALEGPELEVLKIVLHVPKDNCEAKPRCLQVFLLPFILPYGERRLSKVANQSTHMSVVGNFVGAQLAVLVGWKEFAMAFWAIGLVHYLVVFVTLYQRLPTNETFPKELHPVFFLFIAAPSAASVAWEMIIGDFDFVSKIVLFVSTSSVD
ncbi:hypothetical protein O6H91_17G029400 [Diphasiastrum complanatum]|uniref:Uncharacterized protein n=1 Tax=Diphasiastrum complanatum TaxID=34168 RepID=A0ACC2B591_DIPCM|nr:hypothetical protein O6H91_17G029400 [Diphasiastrum complanatum]